MLITAGVLSLIRPTCLHRELSLLESSQEYQWCCYRRNVRKTWRDGDAQAQVYLYRHRSHPRLQDIPMIYFASNRPVASSSGDRHEFLGSYRTEQHPLGVERGNCNGGELWCGDPCAASQVKQTISPGETAQLAFFLSCIHGTMSAFPKSKGGLAAQLALMRTDHWVASNETNLTHGRKNIFPHSTPGSLTPTLNGKSKPGRRSTPSTQADIRARSVRQLLACAILVTTNKHNICSSSTKSLTACALRWSCRRSGKASPPRASSVVAKLRLKSVAVWSSD